MIVQPSYNYAATISKSDSANITAVGAACPVQAVYVGGMGDLVAVFPDGSTATFKSIPAGTILPITIIRVNDSNTSASDMLALYTI